MPPQTKIRHLTVEQQIETCRDIIEECGRSNDRLARLVARLAEMVAGNLEGHYAHFQ